MDLAEFTERYIPADEAAATLGVTVQTVRRMVRAGELRPVAVGSKHFFERQVVLDFKPHYRPVPHRRKRKGLLL